MEDNFAKKGFITFRDFITRGFPEQLIDKFRIWIARLWLGITVYTHTKKDLEKLLEKTGFRFTSAQTLLYTFKRYSLINS